MLLAAGWDFFSFEIPNWLPGGALLLFAIYAIAVPLGLGDILVRIGLGIALLIAGIALFSIGVFGGGDAKLIAAAGPWMGWPWVLPFLVLTALFGGVLALLLLAFRHLKLPERVRSRPWVARLHDKNGGIPYGVAIAPAGVLVLGQQLFGV